MTLSSRRVAILAEGTLDFHHGKTAVSLLRYRPEDVVAVIDSENAGRTAQEALGLGGSIPIVASIEDTDPLHPGVLLIGIAPRGGGLPVTWRRQILYAIERGMDVVSGLHFMLNEDQEFRSAAGRQGVHLVDVRRPPDDLSVAQLCPRRSGSRVITFVGSDCAVGKMTAALEVDRAARRSGLSTAFVATGQTGIMLEGEGIAIDRVIGDFMAGATERLVVEAAERADWVLVEGQGSLLHPAYSGVTLALLHGSAPDAMILVHMLGHVQIDDYPVNIPSLDRLVRIYEEAAGWVKPAPVVGIALNTRGFGREEAHRAIADAERLTGLPATDPVRFEADKLVEAVRAALEPPPDAAQPWAAAMGEGPHQGVGEG
jgi:uncharacterized NAD-dependent epimerase/dehydratase family protein